jgi:hypothetical protein
MRKTIKFFHTLASCGLIGGIFAYGVILLAAPQDTPIAFADMRETVAIVATYVIVPSLAVALVSGLLSMGIHRPFQELRWAWLKALLGISMFEATLGVVQSKANTAAALSAKIAAGEAQENVLAEAIAYEWHALAVILLIAVLNIVLGVWRPALKPRPAKAS